MHVKVQKTRVRFPKTLKMNLTEIVEMKTDKARIITIDKLQTYIMRPVKNCY